MKYFVLTLILTLGSTVSYGFDTMSDVEMENTTAQGLNFDTSGNIKITETNGIDLLMDIFGVNIQNIQFKGIDYAGNAPLTILPDGSLMYTLPDIEEIYVPNYMGIGDIQIMNVKMNGTAMVLKFNK